jgi:long-chain acyl-CoA synthetase
MWRPHRWVKRPDRMNPWHTYPVPRQRLEAWNGDRVVRCFAERSASLFSLFERALHGRPAHDAVVFEGQRWTYAQAATEVARAASGFALAGVARGDRVALFISNRPEFVWVLLALQRLGAIAVPIGVREQRTGLAYMLNQCGAKGVVFDAALAGRIPGVDETPSVTLRVSLGDVPDALPYAAMVAGGAGAPDPVAVAEHETAVILYTSGTTGHPKGAMLTHRNIAHSVIHFQACMQLRAGDRSALAVPASHVTGLIAIVAAMLHVGGAIVVIPEFKAADFIAVVAAERVTHTLMVPAMYKLCLLSPGFAQHDLSRWRIGGYGGAPMPVATIDELAQLLPGLTLLNAYGATETTSPATLMPAGMTRAHADSVGVALPCADIRVMDDDGRELPAGETGELWVGGPMVVPGYWDNPQGTAASFTAGYWHSGDLGSIDTEGFVRVFDRKKDMLNRGGFKIYSVEVENTLMALPGVIEAAIVGRLCPVLGERVHAFVHAPGLAPDDERVRAHCRQHLADYKVPETVTWSPTPLPRNANGKLLKRQLRDQLTAPA